VEREGLEEDRFQRKLFRGIFQEENISGVARQRVLTNVVLRN